MYINYILPYRIYSRIHDFIILVRQDEIVEKIYSFPARVVQRLYWLAWDVLNRTKWTSYIIISHPLDLDNRESFENFYLSSNIQPCFNLAIYIYNY